MRLDQSDQAGWGGARDVGESWAQFDSLPRGLKRCYWEAPYAYTAIAAVRAMRKGLDPRAVAWALTRSHALDLGREALRLYGPDHPQAAEPTPRRPRR